MRPTPTKLDWFLLVALGLVVSFGILSIRLQLMCPHLGVKPFEFLPLSGYVHGHSAHLFTRIMHNLTHPIPLFSYALALGYLAIRPISKSTAERPSLFLLFGLAAFHLAFFALYFITLFLPIGFGVEINR
jgi:hypothetical protein